MKIIFFPQAYDDLVAIKHYIAEENEETAKKVINNILEEITKLEDFPNMGLQLSNKIKCDHRYRYLIKFSYGIIYRIEDENVLITNVLHLSRDFSHLKFDK